MLNLNIRLDIPLGRGVMGCNAKFRRINLKVLSTDAFCLDSAQIRLPHLKICIEELRLKTKETFMRDGNQDCICIFLPNYPTFKKADLNTENVFRSTKGESVNGGFCR